jgi:hypothetical protein
MTTRMLLILALLAIIIALCATKAPGHGSIMPQRQIALRSMAQDLRDGVATSGHVGHCWPTLAGAGCWVTQAGTDEYGPWLFVGVWGIRGNRVTIG